MLRRRPRRPPAPTVALAGSGAGATLHALAAAVLDVPVSAVASRDGAHAAELAARTDARPCRYDELPAGADLVVVATPPGLHLAHALTALAGGARVVVEGPLAATLADADSLVEAAGSGGGLTYAENLAFAPLVRRAVREARGLAPLGDLEVRALSPRPAQRHLDDPAWGGGALLDLGAHAVAVALLLAEHDEPVSVTAELDGAPGSAVDDAGQLRLTFRSGLVGRIEVSWRHADAVWDLQVAGPTGVARAQVLPGAELERDGDPVPLPPDAGGATDTVTRLGFTDQLRPLVAGDGPVGMDASFGRRVLEVIAAGYTSARAGTAVALPYDGPRDRTPSDLWRG